MLDVKDFINFVRAHDPEREYDYSDQRNCPLASYFNALGIKKVWVGGVTYDIVNGEPFNLATDNPNHVKIPSKVADALSAVSIDGGATFGKLLDRLGPP